MKTNKTQTPKQKLASILRRTEYTGCTGQTSYHGMDRFSIQIFADKDDARFQDKPLNPQGSRIVLDINL